jgi:hypothetical protein
MEELQMNRALAKEEFQREHVKAQPATLNRDIEF